MEASYTWHPGARCLNPRWPLSPSILPDELFSSWLVRTAHAHGCLPNTLTGVVWPGTHAWSVDLDRGHPWANLEVLAGVTGVSMQAISASMLCPVLHRLQPGPIAQRTCHPPWILPLGCRHHSHAGGLLCCSRCITGPVPHYLLQHRLAWHTVCPWHHVLLIDRCPACNSALQPERLHADRPLFECYQCGRCLGDALPGPVVESALAFQVFADVASGSKAPYGQEQLSFPGWMCIARVMVSYLQNATRQASLGSQRFFEAIGVDTSQLQRSSLGLPFEYLTPAERAGLLGQAWVIMQAGPERFMELATEFELPITAFPLPAIGVPEILMRMFSVLYRHAQHKPGRQCRRLTRTPLDVWRMWNRLQRRINRDGIS